METDHKPLEVITKKSLLSAPRRLQRMLLALQRYDLGVIYKPGEQQVIADTLSRLPAEQPQAEELSPQEIFQSASMQEEAQELEGIEEREFVRVKDQRLEEVKTAAATDPEQLALSQMIGRGWPSSIREVPSLARKYWTFREALVMQDEVIYKGGQVVVPELLRMNYLRRLHSSHLGSQSTLRRARDAVYWPNMANDISKATAECPICEQDSPAQAKQSLLVHEIPKEPWGKVGMDLFCCRGKDYLLSDGLL